MDPIWDSFPFYMRTVQSYPGCQRLFTRGFRLWLSLTCRPVADETKLPVAREKKPLVLRVVPSRTGTKITRVESAIDTKSYRSEFVFRPIPCESMKRNVWRAIRTHTGPSSSRSHVITPNYIRLKTPKTIPCSAAHNRFASGWHVNTNKWRQREYRYWGSIGFKLHCHSYSILYPLLHTVIAMIYLRSHYSPFSHRP